jgi:DNA-binding CsgD family transcriptional regulator
MTAFEVLKQLTSQLKLVGSGEEIGRALFCASKNFGFTTALVVDVTKLFDRIGPAVIFSATGRGAVDVADEERPFAQHPFVLRAQTSERPFVMSRVREAYGERDDEWWSRLPAHLRNMDGIVVPVHDQGGLAWYSGFAGRAPDLSQRTLSIMSAAVHAGYARFKDLLDSTMPRSPLTLREAECLRWVADGKTDAEIGTILGIAARTVRFHINNAKLKLGVATRIQAVAKRVGGAA